MLLAVVVVIMILKVDSVAILIKVSLFVVFAVVVEVVVV